MVRNILRSIYRNLWKNKIYATINILGLSLGLTAFILLVSYVHYEYSYDKLHLDADHIYRVESMFYRGQDMTDHWPTSTNGYARALRDNLSQVQSFTRINWHNSERVVKYGEIKFREEHVCFADSNFFTFFSYPLLRGVPSEVLMKVNTVVISASAAKKYFGHADPVGKFLDISTLGDHYHCMVSGIFKDLPANSTMQFNFLMSWATMPEWQKDFWYLHESYTFLKLPSQQAAYEVEQAFPDLAEKFKTGPALKDLKWAIRLVPLAQIHLNVAKPYEIEVKGNRSAVHFLNILAYVILVIAWINYVNLSTAKAIDRAKEVGIRKVSGARPSQLIAQFLLESFILHLIALLLAVLLCRIAGYFLVTYLAGGFSYGLLFDPGFYREVAMAFFTGVLLSGIYPALILSRLKPAAVLKGRFSFSKAGVILRKYLVILQFGSSLILIAGTLAIYKQIRFMASQNLGVNIDQVLVMKAPVNETDYVRRIENFRNSLHSINIVGDVSFSGSVPGREVGEFLANRRFGASKQEERTYEMLKVDHDFIPAYHLQLLAGRAFDRDRPADSTGLVLNESAVRQFGFKSPQLAVGSKVWLEVNKGAPNEVIGVIRDYHQQSLQQKFTPIILFMDPHYPWIPANYCSVRVRVGDLTNTLSRIRNYWNDNFPQSSFDYFFLEPSYQRQYQQDNQFGSIFLSFSGLAICIACMGLFGLTAYSTTRKNREIAVRKVLGASTQNVVVLLIGESLKLILLSSLIALPLSYLVIQKWLQSYAFRCQLSWQQFVFPVIVLLLLALITISWLTAKAALRNPVGALKME